MDNGTLVVKDHLREEMQKIFLKTISRTDFFDNAAFYGGTALRLFHGLDRFSEDLDFSLLKPFPEFNLESYHEVIVDGFLEYGIEVTVKKINKRTMTTVQTSNVVAKYQSLSHFCDDVGMKGNFHRDELLKIKFEIDTMPPSFAGYEWVELDSSRIRLYDFGSLFAGKVSAVLTRGWNNRVKGRDFYDFIYYINNGIELNMCYLQSSLKKMNNLEGSLTDEKLRRKLEERFRAVDYESAKEDIVNFISDGKVLDCWDSDYFISLLDNLKISYKGLC